MSDLQTQYIAISSPYRRSGKTTLARLLAADILQRFGSSGGAVHIHDEDGYRQGRLVPGRVEPQWEDRRHAPFATKAVELLAVIYVNRPLPTPAPHGDGPSLTAWRHITLIGGLFQR